MVWGDRGLVLFDDHMTTFADVEAWLNDEVPAVFQLDVAPDSNKISVHSEAGLREPRGEGVGVVPRHVLEVQSGAHEVHGGVLQSCKIHLDQVAGHYRILLTQVWHHSIAMFRDWSEKLRRDEG